MRIEVHNILTGEKGVENFEKSLVHVGRHATNDIVLPSLMVAKEHAVLICENGAWFLENRTTAETQVGNLLIEDGRRVKLNLEDDIRIGQYNLRFLADTEEARIDQAYLDFMKQLVTLETRVHDDLLVKLNLRASNQKDLHTKETMEKVEEALEGLLEQNFAELDPDLSRFIVTLYVQRQLTARITLGGEKRAGSRDLDEFLTQTSAMYEEMLKDICSRLARDMNLALDARQMKEDMQKLERGFGSAFPKYRLEFSQGLQKYVYKRLIKKEIKDIIFGLGPLTDLLNIGVISEIMVVSRDQIFIEKFGVIEETGRGFVSDEAVMAVLERIVSPIGRRIDKSQPLVDARLPDGSRVNAVIPPLALKGPCITIRKFSKVPLSMESLIDKDALSPRMANFLKGSVQGRKNIVVSGGTGSGKTTLLNSLSAFIPPKERIVTIEDSAELQLKQKHVVSLEAKPPNVEGKGAVTIRDLVKNALRMRPDRIVVGECRGGEALDMLQAMNTGHDGSLTTAHANTPEDLMRRLEAMVLMAVDIPLTAIREMIVSAVHIVVQLSRFPDGSRKITHISEVIGIHETLGNILVEDIFLYKFGSGAREGEIEGIGGGRGKFYHTGYVPRFIEEFIDKGILSLDNFF